MENQGLTRLIKVLPWQTNSILIISFFILVFRGFSFIYRGFRGLSILIVKESLSMNILMITCQDSFFYGIFLTAFMTFFLSSDFRCEFLPQNMICQEVQPLYVFLGIELICRPNSVSSSKPEVLHTSLPAAHTGTPDYQRHQPAASPLPHYKATPTLNPASA